MSSLFRLREPLGERGFDAGQLPISIGGAGAVIMVPGAADGEILAHLGVEDGRLFVQPAAGGTLWLHAGMRLPMAQARLMLLPGSPPLLLLQHDLDNRTAPPDIAPPATRGDEAAGSVPLTPVAFEPRATAVAPPDERQRSRLTAALALSILAVMAIAAFVVGSRAIGVRFLLEPADARMIIEGSGIHPRIAGRYWLMPGNYSLQVSREGFEPLRRPLAVNEAAATDIRIALRPSPSPVSLAGLPAQARVYWDENPAPRNPTVLAAGRHRLRVEAPRYETYESQVQVSGGGAMQVVRPVWISKFAAVNILSDPEGARVLVDEREAGQTPVTMELDAGLRSIVLSHPSAKPWRGSVLVHGGEAQTVGPVRLSAPDAQLSVTSTPAGADVSVGGQYRGRTPVQVRLAAGLDYEIAVQRAGFAAVTRRADLRSATRVRVDVKLEPVLGEINVQGEPVDARVFVDGVEAGTAGRSFKLPAASTRIEIRKSGFDAYQVTLTPKPDYPQLLIFKLAPAGTSQHSALPKVIRSSAGIELKLIPTGEFEMGSNRREPGRRSNELQRQVRLQRNFYMAATEVTNGEFRRFKESHSSGVFRSKTLDLDNQPVVEVSWEEAVEFCNWLSVQDKLEPAYVKADQSWTLNAASTGYRLPTEAEWEFAARYDGAAATLRYPWGAGLPIAPNTGNFADSSARFTLDAVLENYADGYAVSAAPRKFPPNALGLYDMGGNVAEWVHDFYSAAPPDSEAVQTDPTGPAQGREHVVRGSSFRSASITELRLAHRDGAAEPRVDLGFRVARYANQ